MQWVSMEMAGLRNVMEAGLRNSIKATVVRIIFYLNQILSLLRLLLTLLRNSSIRNFLLLKKSIRNFLLLKKREKYVTLFGAKEEPRMTNLAAKGQTTPHTSHTSHLTPHTPHTPHTSHTSHLTLHTSHLTPHTSHLTPHTSHLTGFYELFASKATWKIRVLLSCLSAG